MLLLVSVLALVGATILVRLQGSDSPTMNAGSTVTPAAPSSRPSAEASSAGTTPHGTPTPGSSSAGPTGSIHLLGFGDSVMAGAGCDCDDFLQQTGALLKQGTARSVITVNNSANGETAAGLLTDLRTDDSLTAEIRTADVIVLTIGANDLGPALDDWVGDACDRSCYHPEVEAMGDRLSAILTLVDRSKRAGASVFVLTYWNVFEDGDVGAGDYDEGYLTWSDQVTRDANATLCQAAELAAATCVDTYAPFKGADGGTDPTHLLAEDGDHPNEAGTTLIATVVAAAVERHGVSG